MNNRFATAAAVIAGIVLFYIGYVYARTPAGSLPGYFPGYLAGSPHIHMKHSIAAFLLGAACWVYAWFKSAPKAA